MCAFGGGRRGGLVISRWHIIGFEISRCSGADGHIGFEGGGALLGQRNYGSSDLGLRDPSAIAVVFGLPPLPRHIG